jgi:hypothetical protein
VNPCSDCKSSCKCGLETPMHSHVTTVSVNSVSDSKEEIVKFCQWCLSAEADRDEGN